jgi:hypothetical protein
MSADLTHSRVALPEAAAFSAPRLRGAASTLVGLGLIAFVALLFTDLNRAWHAWLIGLVIPAFVSVAALAFLAVHRLCNARWTAPLKRVAEGLSSGLPITLLAFIPFAVVGLPYVYDWAYLAAHDPAGQLALLHGHGKASWLSPERVSVSTVVILAIWIALRFRLVRLSFAEDAGVDNRGTQVTWSVIFLLVMAYTFTLFAWDLVLSLNVHVVSSMWGVYEFVGAVQGFLALLTLCLVGFAHGPLKGIIREHTLKDVGTWLLAWSCVWAYITFAQYVIIAFANMDEETQWFLMRQQNGYQYPFFIECVLRLPVPFFLLLSQHTRTKAPSLILAGGAILLGFLIELIWQVLPALFPNHVPAFGAIPELLVALGFLGGHLLLALAFWHRHGAYARGDRDLLAAVNADHLP